LAGPVEDHEDAGGTNEDAGDDARVPLVYQ
jgi:hypothetical protein